MFASRVEFGVTCWGHFWCLPAPFGPAGPPVPAPLLGYEVSGPPAPLAASWGASLRFPAPAASTDLTRFQKKKKKRQEIEIHKCVQIYILFNSLMSAYAWPLFTYLFFLWSLTTFGAGYHRDPHQEVVTWLHRIEICALFSITEQAWVLWIKSGNI